MSSQGNGCEYQPLDKHDGLLSSRAAAEATPQAKNLVWEVMSNPWHIEANPSGYLSVGTAENRLMHNELQRYITNNVNLGDCTLTYGDGPNGSHRLRRAMAHFLNNHLAPCSPIEPQHILITNGTTHAIEHMAWALADPGEAFLLGRPYYPGFMSDFGMRPDVEIIEVAFGGIDPLGVDAVKSYEKAFLLARASGVKVKGLILCNPHNPLGRCYSHAALIEYLKFCQKYQLHLISDEVYALSVWSTGTLDPMDGAFCPMPSFESVLSLPLDSLIDAELVHVLWGLSKDFGSSGMRVGCIISQRNTPLLHSIESVGIYSYTSSFSDQVAATMLEDDFFSNNYVANNQCKLSEAYIFTCYLLRQHGIEYEATANAAFFLWVDLGQAYLKHHPHRKYTANITDEVMDALIQYRVYLGLGTIFGSEQAGMFRIVFTHPRSHMEEAIRRIALAVKNGCC